MNTYKALIAIFLEKILRREMSSLDELDSLTEDYFAETYNIKVNRYEIESALCEAVDLWNEM